VNDIAESTVQED